MRTGVLVATLLLFCSVLHAQFERKQVYLGRNESGAVEDLYLERPSAAILDSLKTEKFELKQIRLIGIDLASQSHLAALVRSPKLVEVALEDCNVAGIETLVDGAAQKKLYRISLSDCRITNATFKDIATLSHAKCVRIGRPIYDKADPLNYSVLHHCPAREIAILGDPSFSDCSWLKGLESLEDLRLADSGIDDKALSQIAAIPNLTWLDIAGTPVTSDGLSGLQSSTLRDIIVGSDSLSTQALEALVCQNSIRRLTFHNMTMESIDLSGICASRKLKRLNVKGTRKTAKALVTIPLTTSLEEINSRYCVLEDKVFSRLALLQSLRTVDVSQCQVSLEQLVTLASNPSIHTIRCYDCGLTPDTEDKLARKIGRRVTIEHAPFAALYRPDLSESIRTKD